MKRLVIEIPDGVYDYIKDSGHISPHVNIASEIANGIVLPEGHGDLIDRDVALAEFDEASCSWEGNLLKYSPTVIPTDK